ncbi:adenosylcobinamide-phosphate synthase [Hydrogenispora ethanolica]|uniref:Cobalamin biosynthesis protein CobD n=1 Tax=Hydrogenispora ethanolica TaxID=1082276 RepID=A0A4R1S4B6_HYDET|nr:adenosylcobinamide-phosphate synthase CbiB [Hydrogenispora ethanolica]TCL74085.1 adenosylcobinamide-phosphate synthase [Hydrogenispora ethanolica]
MAAPNLLTVLSGLGVDGLVGDPPRLPHPVVGLGWVIAGLERWLNRPGRSPLLLRWLGILTVGLVVGLAFGATLLLLEWLGPVGWLYWPVNAWLMGTTVARRGLQEAGSAIYRALRNGDLAAARAEAGKIVGRDTGGLGEAEVVRAGVESVAENTVDGIIAPLCYGLLGGTPLAMAYRAVNTLDSMLGYKNERFRHFGWAAARLDDLANYLPARLTGLLLVAAAGLLGGAARQSWRIMRRDARKHPSPNGGWPEAAVAGALGIRLGGFNVYHGRTSFRAYLGNPDRPLEAEDLRRAVRLLNGATVLWLVLAAVIGLGMQG